MHACVFIGQKDSPRDSVQSTDSCVLREQRAERFDPILVDVIGVRRRRVSHRSNICEDLPQQGDRRGLTSVKHIFTEGKRLVIVRDHDKTLSYSILPVRNAVYVYLFYKE